MNLGSPAGTTTAPTPPPVRLCLGVVGHRENNAVFAANRLRVQTALDRIFDTVDEVLATMPGKPDGIPVASVRLHSLLADGVDQLGAAGALARRWELVAPLPFGRTLNLAINAHPASTADARALLAGELSGGGELQRRAQAIRRLTGQARTFELADADDAIKTLFLSSLESPGDAVAQEFSAQCSARVALASRVLIEQSDIVIAVWDGTSRDFVGGTGHTVCAALERGAPVLWVDANVPETWRLLRTPESLACTPVVGDEDLGALLGAMVRSATLPLEGGTVPLGEDVQGGLATLDSIAWHPQSHPLFYAYRRVEALFGGEPGPFRDLRQTYELPDDIAAGSAAVVLEAVRTLPGGEPDLAQRIEAGVLRPFAWADGISTRFSDFYRGGMVTSILFSALAIVMGGTYPPFAIADHKWLFALAEFALLVAILAITALGRKKKWHTRWFETRRVAEYFRHSPLLLTLGVARPPGLWPRGTGASWPEWYARQGLRDIGLPCVVVSRDYLRAALEKLLDAHVEGQRDYHLAKARRLGNVHRNLDRLSHWLFVLAVISVTLYLGLRAAAAFAFLPGLLSEGVSMLFTFVGLLLPTFGAAVSGIRDFGDFERFAAISEVTAEKLDALHQRVQILLAAPVAALDYASVADLAHQADEIVVAEIENWQAVFGGKQITVPV